MRTLQRNIWTILLLTLTAVSVPACSFAAPAANAPVTLSNDQPVDITADQLEVQQDKKQAIFTGKVIATQGEVTIRAAKMVVHYTNAESTDKESSKATEKNKAANSSATQGISRIDASGNVEFTNQSDMAKGDSAVYLVAQETLDLIGNVVLTRDKNVLKGTRMHYDLKTSRSVLTSGDKAVSDTGKPASGGGRVRGVFVPNKQPKSGQ